jgi:hypothetical protein
MPAELLWTAAAVALVLLASGAWAAYALWAELRGTRAWMRKLHRQQANIVSMLLRAGFKMGPTRDWGDDGRRTSVMGESTETKWDWRTPADR